MGWLTNSRVAQGTTKRLIAQLSGVTKRDRAAVPALIDAVQGEYFTVRSRVALALGKTDNTRASSHF